MVDHEMAGQAIHSLPKAQQWWVAKTAARFLPYGKNMKCWHLKQEDQCPRCHQPAEDKNHITQCSAMMAQQKWDKTIEALDLWLTMSGTAPIIHNEILDGLKWWQTADMSPLSSMTSEAATEQELLGWDLALEGCISRKWRKQQDVYWKIYKTRKSSWQWTTESLKKLMGIAWDMWQHHNEVLHEDAGNRHLILEVELNQQVTLLYELGHSTFANKTILKHLLPELLQLPQAYKQNWLETATTIAKQQQDKHKARPYQQEWWMMHIWLTTFNQPPNI